MQPVTCKFDFVGRLFLPDAYCSRQPSQLARRVAWNKRNDMERDATDVERCQGTLDIGGTYAVVHRTKPEKVDRFVYLAGMDGGGQGWLAAAALWR